MKNVYIIFWVILIGFTNSLQAQTKAEIKAEKIAKQEQEFQKTLALTESKNFKIKINKVYPSGGFDVSRFNPEGYVNIKDSIAEGRLPFFGRAYSVPYGEGAGIEFNDSMKELTIKIDKKKKGNKIILWKFSVPSKNDVFQIQLEISNNGNCSVNVNSNNRVNISYSGEILPLTEEKKQ